MKTKISELRDKLYESLSTGDVDTFELIKLIKEHIKELDKLDKKFISKEQAKKELRKRLLNSNTKSKNYIEIPDFVYWLDRVFG